MAQGLRIALCGMVFFYCSVKLWGSDGVFVGCTLSVISNIVNLKGSYHNALLKSIGLLKP